MLRWASNFWFKFSSILLTIDLTSDVCNKSIKQHCTFKYYGTFDSNIKNERENIRNELTLVDTSTGEETMLVDIDSIDEPISSAEGIETYSIGGSTNSIYDEDEKISFDKELSSK